MSNIIAGAMQGLGGGIKDAGLEMLRAEITKERDARLNQYAVSLETDVKQPFQAGQQQREIGSREGMQGSQITSTEGIHQADRESRERIAANKLKSDKKAASQDRLLVNDGAAKIGEIYGAKQDPITRMVDTENVKDKPGYFKDMAELERRVRAGEPPLDVANQLADRAFRKQKGAGPAGGEQKPTTPGYQGVVNRHLGSK